MSEKRTVLRLVFSADSPPELVRTHFEIPDGEPVDQCRKNFSFGIATKAFCLCMIDYLIWSFQRPPEDFSFAGPHGESPASSLHDAINQTRHAFHDFFDGNRRTKLVFRTSPKKEKEIRWVAFRKEFLPDSVEISIADERVKTDEALRQLWEGLNAQLEKKQVLAIEKENSAQVASPAPAELQAPADADSPPPPRPEKDYRRLRISDFLALAAIPVLVGWLLFKFDPPGEPLTQEERQRIMEVGAAFGPSKRAALKAFSHLKAGNPLSVEQVIARPFSYGDFKYSVALVYAATLRLPPTSMRFVPATKTLLLGQGAVIFDRPRTLLLPVEAERISNPSQKSTEAALGQFNPLLEEHVMKAGERPELRDLVKQSIVLKMEERLKAALEPILASGVEVKVIIAK